MLANFLDFSASPGMPQAGSRLRSIIPESENLQLFQIQPNGLSSDYANALNAVVLSLRLVDMSLEGGDPADPDAVKTLQQSIEEMPTYTDFVIDTLLPRIQNSQNMSVRNLTRNDFIEENPGAVRRLDELANLMKYSVQQVGDRVIVYPGTIVHLARQMALILLGTEPSSLRRFDLFSLIKGLWSNGGVNISDDPGQRD